MIDNRQLVLDEIEYQTGALGGNTTATIVYLAGPMSGRPQFNFHTFNDAERYARDFGCRPINPHRLDSRAGIETEFLQGHETFSAEEVAGMARRDLEALLACEEVWLLPGWEDSKGAQHEKQVADWLGLHCYEWHPAIGVVAWPVPKGEAFSTPIETAEDAFGKAFVAKWLTEPVGHEAESLDYDKHIKPWIDGLNPGPTEVPYRMFTTKDSGERAEFESGMVRDTNDGKARFDLLVLEGVPYADQPLTRVAELLARGAQKYSARNWEKANGKAELDRFGESMLRHAMQLLAGETDEDHGAAVVFNALAYMATAHKLTAVKPDLQSEES